MRKTELLANIEVIAIKLWRLDVPFEKVAEPLKDLYHLRQAVENETIHEDEPPKEDTM